MWGMQESRSEMGRRVSPTSPCDGSALPSDAGVSQKPPLSLHPHLTLQVVLFWDLEARERNKVSREPAGEMFGSRMIIWKFEKN